MMIIKLLAAIFFGDKHKRASMEQIPLKFLSSASSILTWATFALAICTALVGWISAQVRSETGRRADLRVATADEKAATALASAATANERAEALKAENFATQERLISAEHALEIERIARIRLQKATAPRTLAPETKEKISEVLTGYKQSVRVLSISDMEAQELARSFIETFDSIGLEVYFYAFEQSAQNFYGFSYWDPHGPDAEFAVAMVNIFGRAGLLLHDPMAGMQPKKPMPLTPMPTVIIYLRPSTDIHNARELKPGRQ
ncbi:MULTISPECIES: hypothetical protein [unclassified Novosphingobium]|uniref:hypothetical protein n=2 Tax=Novosphingobium TaxID=165696 RepID=UPI001AC9B368|nr:MULTISPECIES: hypothetical protein [unclassified Novosphingobium]MBN9143774.1 hypothetical protein [Novosphingobium sp.]